MGTKIDKSQRMATATLLHQLASNENGLAHVLSQMTKTHPPSGSALGEGLTTKERAYVTKLYQRHMASAKRLRELAWHIERGGTRRAK